MRKTSRDLNILMAARGEINLSNRVKAPKKGKGAKYNRAKAKRQAFAY